MNSIPIQSFSDVLESIDSDAFAKLMKEEITDLEAQLLIEFQKSKQKPGGISIDDINYLQHATNELTNIRRAMRNVTVIQTKLERLKVVSGIARDVFLLEERTRNLTGQRLPIINILVECLLLSMHFHHTKSIKGNLCESHYKDPKGVPYRLRVLSRPEIISLNVATSDCVRNIYAERTRQGKDLMGRFTPDETGILHTGMLLKYYSLFM